MAASGSRFPVVDSERPGSGERTGSALGHRRVWTAASWSGPLERRCPRVTRGIEGLCLRGATTAKPNGGVCKVSYQGFVPSIAALLGLALLALWSLTMVALMWRRSSRPAFTEVVEGLPAPSLTAG